jgi:hypothetical protein
MHVSTVRVVPVYIRFHGLVFSSGYVALVWRSGIGFRLFYVGEQAESVWVVFCIIALIGTGIFLYENISCSEHTYYLGIHVGRLGKLTCTFSIAHSRLRDFITTVDF